MRWSWKLFALLFVSAFVLGLGLAYVISMMIDARRGPGAPDSTLISMKIGGLLAPTVLAAVTGWIGWSVRPLLVAGIIVSTIYSGSLGHWHAHLIPQCNCSSCGPQGSAPRRL